VDVVTTAAVPVRVRAAGIETTPPATASPSGTPVAAAPPDDGGEPPLWMVIVGALLVPMLVSLFVGLTRRRGRGLHRQ
jgi:hypothetical protein